MRHIAISFERSSWLIERIEIEGIRLSNDEIDAFAIADSNHSFKMVGSSKLMDLVSFSMNC